MILKKLHFQVFIAMILGCILGLLLKNFEASWLATAIYNVLVILGTVFVRLLKMIMVPLIFSSIILGVSSIGSGKKIGRIGLKTLCYYLFTSLCAIIIGLSLSNYIMPGVGATSVRLVHAESGQRDEPPSVGAGGGGCWVRYRYAPRRLHVLHLPGPQSHVCPGCVHDLHTG